MKATAKGKEPEEKVGNTKEECLRKDIWDWNPSTFQF